jgi:hypothetical protein
MYYRHFVGNVRFLVDGCGAELVGEGILGHIVKTLRELKITHKKKIFIMFLHHHHHQPI